MILTEKKSGHNSSASDKNWDKLMADYSWFLPSGACMEKVLFEDVRKGDPKAQLKYYKFYYGQMFDISYKLVCSSSTAEEIVRESFMVAFEKTGSFKRHGDFSSFLKRLVAEKSVETWKRNNIGMPVLVTDKILVK